MGTATRAGDPTPRRRDDPRRARRRQLPRARGADARARGGGGHRGRGDLPRPRHPAAGDRGRASPTSSSPTSGCRRPRPTRAPGRRRRCAARTPQIGVVILSQFAEPQYGLALLEGGSDGRAYLLKERIQYRGQLVAAIESVAQGGSVIDAKVVEALVAARTRAEHSPLNELTPRELEILTFVARGHSNQAIADELVLTKRAVEKHINAIFLKLGPHRRRRRQPAGQGRADLPRRARRRLSVPAAPHARVVHPTAEAGMPVCRADIRAPQSRPTAHPDAKECIMSSSSASPGFGRMTVGSPEALEAEYQISGLWWLWLVVGIALDRGRARDPAVRPGVGHHDRRHRRHHVHLRRRPAARARRDRRLAALAVGDLRRPVPDRRRHLLRQPREHVRRPGRHPRLPVPERRRVVDDPRVPDEGGRPALVDSA